MNDISSLHDIHNFLVRGPQRVSDYQLFVHSEFPPNCPWGSFRDLTIEQTIHQSLHPLAHKIPQTIEQLNAYCLTIYSLVENGRWYLIYKLAESAQPANNYLIGGPPQVSSGLSKVTLENQWAVPKSLATFYQVHDGFGLLWPFGLFWNSDCILPAHRLKPLSLSSQYSENLLRYEPSDLLEFFPDGAGNGQYFYRNSDTPTEITVDWDHETKEISLGKDFWEFIDNQFQRLITTGR